MMPAQVLLHLLKNPALQIADLSGTVWSGAAGQVTIAGGDFFFDAGQVQWVLKPDSLLSGNLCMDFVSEKNAVMRRDAPQSIAGTFCAGISGSLIFTDTSLELPASALLHSDELRLTGTISGYIEQLAFSANSVLHQFSAQGLWSGAGMNAGTGSSQLRFQAGDLPFELVRGGPRTVQLTANNLELAAIGGTTGIDLSAELATTGDINLRAMIVAESGMPAYARDWIAVLAEQRSATEYYVEWRR